MLSKQALKEILQLVRQSDGCFVILEDDKPKFAILDFNLYETLVKKTEPVKELEAGAKYSVLLTGAAGRLGELVGRKLIAQGHSVTGLDRISSAGTYDDFVQVELTDEHSLSEIFSERRFDFVFHLAERSGHQSSWDEPESFFVNNIEGGTALLKQMARHNVGKMIYRSAANHDTPYSRTKILFEQILNFYQHGFGINSVSLRLPNVAYLTEQVGEEDVDNLVTENPLAAVLLTAAGKITCLPVPQVGESTADGTPRLELISAHDAADSFVFALHNFADSSGSLVYRVPGVATTLGEVIEQTLEATNKMVATTRVEKEVWSAEEDQNIPSLAQAGWRPGTPDLPGLIAAFWQEVGGQAAPAAKEEISEKYEAPISLSDLLSGKYTPFIKPHSS